MGWFISKLSSGWFVNVMSFIIVAQLLLLNMTHSFLCERQGLGDEMKQEFGTEKSAN
jgi:hypothetical protein